MITKEEATKCIEQALPEYTVKLGPVVYKNLYLFSLYNDGFGGELDPFYSVNRSTGFVSGFSIEYQYDWRKPCSYMAKPF